MGYTMVFYVDGGCRNNGYSNAIGAAAAVQMLRGGGHRSWYRQIYDNPTNQRAEITAIIIALQEALQAYDELDTNPYLHLTIYSDSRYAIGCMTDWIYKWTRNGWINSAGNPVANRDLIQEASDLDDEVKALGDVTYRYIPRSENELADGYCNDALDDM